VTSSWILFGDSSPMQYNLVDEAENRMGNGKSEER
jgi:hypothetical protein